MVEGAMPKPLQDLASAFLVAMVAGGVLLGWLNNRGRPPGGEGISTDGSNAADGLHHHGWWDTGDHDCGHHGSGGDAGH